LGHLAAVVFWGTRNAFLFSHRFLRGAWRFSMNSCGKKGAPVRKLLSFFRVGQKRLEQVL
jgi:hypothetical protein